MNDLLSRSFSKFKTSQREDVEMATTSGDAINLDTFFEDVETVKEDLKEIDELLKSLKDAHEKGTTLHNANAVKDLRSKMDQDVSVSLNKAKLIKVRLEALDRANVTSRREPNCGPGSTSDRTRTSVVNGLRKKLKEKMDEFQELRERISAEYKETIQRRYFMVTGEKADDSTVERLISTGESETFLQKAIQEQGRGQILDTISEIQERHDGVMDMEKNLKELHQVFMDMSVLVQHQGEHLDDIEAQVHRANSFVRNGTEQLQTARKMQKSSRKWFCISIVLLLVIAVVVLIKFHPWRRKKENKVAETNHILVLF